MPDPVGPNPQDVKDLLQPAGAVPAQQRDEKGQFVPQKPPEGAAPQPGTDGKPAVPAGFAPISALQGEQEVARRAREQAAQLRAELEPLGYQFDAENNIVARPQAATTAQPHTGTVDPDVQELADAWAMTGTVDAGKLQRVVEKIAENRVMQTGGIVIDPIARSVVEQEKRVLAQEDPYFPIYAKTLDQEVEQRINMLPMNSIVRAAGRVHPQLRADALAAAKMKHFDEIVSRAAERKVQELTGKRVGQFTEGAASSVTEGGVTVVIPPGARALYDDLNPEQKKRYIANLAEQQKREGR